MSYSERTYALPGQDHPDNGIVITYTSWGTMYEWRVETAVSGTFVFEHVTNECGNLSVEYRHLNGSLVDPSWLEPIEPMRYMDYDDYGTGDSDE